MAVGFISIGVDGQGRALPQSAPMSKDEPKPYGVSDLTYNRYLKVPELLQLQVPQSEPAHHDEMLFIVIHQTYELWFKLILHELEQAIDHMNGGKVLRARHFVHRVVEISKVLVAQIHILETMKPVEFLEFRHRLMPASGFQSSQFREVEYLCGLKDKRYLHFFSSRPEIVEALEARLAAPDVRTTYYDMLRAKGFGVPDNVDPDYLKADLAAEQQLYDALLPLYQDPEANLPLNLLTESLVSLDEYFALWREHHVRVVERVIGHKRGTGGSSGVGYLKTTVDKRMFPYLWDVRTRLVRQ